MLITYEGIDGCGKSTQAQLLADHLTNQGLTVHLVREPGGTPVSERIRSLLLDVDLEIEPFAEMLLYSAARAQLVRSKLRALLDAGHVVICDRFFDSTVAYQGGGRQIADTDWLARFQREVTNGLVPDRTYLMRVSLETANQRQHGRTADRMERSDSSFYERVVKVYDELAEKNTDRFCSIDGEPAPKKIFECILADLSELPVYRRVIGRSPE